MTEKVEHLAYIWSKLCMLFAFRYIYTGVY